MEEGGMNSEERRKLKLKTGFSVFFSVAREGGGI
jgi:hypothetical protein